MFRLSAHSTAATLALTLLLTLVATAGAQDLRRTGAIAERGFTPADFPKMVQLAEGVYAWSDVHSRGFTTNSLIVITPAGVLVADGQGNVQATQKMVEAIRGLTDQPIRYVVVCSEHGDHTGGNSAFPESATFIAHPFSAGTFQRQAENPARAANAPRVIVPSETVAERRVITLGDKEIHILFEGRAHTGGDLQVYLPQERVLFLSEIYFHRIFPSMRSAHPSEWVEVLKKAEAKNVDVVVPGHGFVDPPQILKTELTLYRRALEVVVNEARRLHRLGLSAEEALRQANWGEFATWTGVEQNAPIALQRVFDELDGKLPGGG